MRTPPDTRVKLSETARMLVTDSQRVVDPIKWRKSAVMSNRWRLINGVELYDIKADPGQTSDLAAKHPDQVAVMRWPEEAQKPIRASLPDGDNVPVPPRLSAPTPANR